jgi:hypothetical protein
MTMILCYMLQNLHLEVMLLRLAKDRLCWHSHRHVHEHSGWQTGRIAWPHQIMHAFRSVLIVVKPSKHAINCKNAHSTRMILWNREVDYLELSSDHAPNT